ncbi:MAG: TonB-dependent receptor plug domain-containing protein [bacterium]
MEQPGAQLYARFALSAICFAASTSCARHSSPEDNSDSATAFSADSVRRVLSARSRSSASKVVDFEMDERARFTRVELMIQAHFPGVQVSSRGGNYAIKIRGSGSLRSNDPLVIIDGASRSLSDLRSMNPLDVKRIEIMKDGAASFYGSRGANGVILITTGRPQ